jgi:hypothetical protein
MPCLPPPRIREPFGRYLKTGNYTGIGIALRGLSIGMECGSFLPHSTEASFYEI